ncbi:MAG: histidine--tRNA ligase [Spirochaetales bacterium]|nr:histidine--tRNA ligase [Spirochaetales bacterium]
MREIIEPRTLRGFRDSLPRQELLKEEIQARLAQVFRRAGFVPIDTPALEYAEILLGKGGGETDKQVYRFRDHGQRDVALRFDLTVPFARFMAAHVQELYLPFKRYHMAKVWRGENTQRGRYREFVQIDFDIVGVDSASADFEILAAMHEAIRALGVERFHIHLSHRELFNEFLRSIGLESSYLEVLRVIDKLGKIGREKVEAALGELAGTEPARGILEFVDAQGSNRDTLEKLAAHVPPDCAPLRRLREILDCVSEAGLGEVVRLDPSITRGLDYYTGVVFETFLDELPGIGSVCSGGRYNDLASLYTKEQLPGVGASIGLDRLLSALEELNALPSAQAAPDVLVLCLDESLVAAYHRLAGELRARGLAAEVYPAGRKLTVQLKYAERRGIPLALFHGEAEAASGTCNLRDLRSRESFDGLTVPAAAETASRLLRS